MNRGLLSASDIFESLAVAQLTTYFHVTQTSRQTSKRLSSIAVHRFRNLISWCILEEQRKKRIKQLYFCLDCFFLTFTSKGYCFLRKQSPRNLFSSLSITLSDTTTYSAQRKYNAENRGIIYSRS